MLLTAAELLKSKSSPSRAEIREYIAGNYCRCTGYHAIVDAVETVAAKRNGKAESDDPQVRCVSPGRVGERLSRSGT